MKKSLIIIFTIFLTALVVIAQDSMFTASLKDCSSFTESGTVNTEGMNVQSTKHIVGWDNDKCIYKETVNFNGLNVTTTCKLSRPQIDELVSVMNAYSLVQEYSNESIDTSKLSEVKNNPVVKAWNKYLMDSSICTMTGLK